MSHQILSCICCDMNVQKCQWTLHDTSNSQKTLIGKRCKCSDLEHYSHCVTRVSMTTTTMIKVPSAMPSRDASPTPCNWSLWQSLIGHEEFCLWRQSVIQAPALGNKLPPCVSQGDTISGVSLFERPMALGCTVVEDTLPIPTWMWLADLWVMLLAP